MHVCSCVRIFEIFTLNFAMSYFRVSSGHIKSFQVIYQVLNRYVEFFLRLYKAIEFLLRFVIYVIYHLYINLMLKHNLMLI